MTSLGDSGPGSLRQAIADAPDGSTIIVPAGTITLASPLAIAKDLTITGAGSGSTILSGGHATRVMTVNGSTTSLTLDGLAITDGSVVSPQGVERGGGVQIDSATVVIRHSVIANNAVDVSGGSGQNGGIVFGGGIANGNGNLTIEDSSVTGNSVAARGGAGRNGGIVDGVGVWSDSGQLTITRSLIAGNSGDVAGGQGPSNPSQNGGIIDGGGIYSGDDSVLRVTDSTVSGNSISAAAGIGSNAGIDEGGGIYAAATAAGAHKLSNVTVSGNLVAAAGGGGVDGGGIGLHASGAGAFDLRSSTLAGNTADGGNGGNLNATGTVRLANTIVSGGVGAPTTSNCEGSPTSLGHNLDSLDQCQFDATGDKTNLDPKLGALQDNGGPVPTQAIPADSPAFDAGDRDLCPPADARGVMRQGAACDIGAFELELADLGLRATASATRIKLGSTITLFFTATNTGPGFGRRAALRALLPSGLAFVSAPTACAAAAGDLACSLGDLAPGGSGPANVLARAVKPGVQSVTGNVTSQADETAPGNNSAAVSVTVDRLALASVKLSRRTFRLGRKLPKLSRRVPTGTTIRFALPEAARVKLSFAKQTGKRKKRFRNAGSFTVRAHAGTNKLRFQGRLSRRRTLRPGRYRLTLTAVDALGNRSGARRLPLRILRP